VPGTRRLCSTAGWRCGPSATSARFSGLLPWLGANPYVGYGASGTGRRFSNGINATFDKIGTISALRACKVQVRAWGDECPARAELTPVAGRSISLRRPVTIKATRNHKEVGFSPPLDARTFLSGGIDKRHRFIAELRPPCTEDRGERRTLRAAVFQLAVRMSFGQLLVGRSQDSPTMPRPGTKYASEPT
jgi:hypothetical protein